MTFDGIDPELLAQIQMYAPGAAAQLSAPSSMSQPTYNTYGYQSQPSSDTSVAAPARADAGPPDDSTNAWDMFTGIVSSPFRLVGAAKEGLEDAIGHPYAQQRAAREAQDDAALKYLLANQSIPDSVKQLLPGYVQPSDRTGIIARQSGGDATALGRDNSTLPVPTPRKTGILPWLTGETRRQQARDHGTIQAALQMAGYDADLKHTNAGTFQATTGGMSNLADVRKKTIEADILDQYGYKEAAAKVRAALLQGNASAASAADSYAGVDLKHGQLGAVNDERRNKNRYFDEVSLPGGLADNSRDATLFSQVTLPGGLETNREKKVMFDTVGLPAGKQAVQQSAQMHPLNMQLKQAETQAKGLNGEIPKGYIDAIKGVTTAVNAASKPKGGISGFFGGTVGDPDSVYDAYGIPKDAEGNRDFNAYLTKFKPTTAPVTARPQSTDIHSIYKLLKERMPGTSEGILGQRAPVIAEKMPTLDFSSEDAFLDSAISAGLSDSEQDVLWAEYGTGG